MDNPGVADHSMCFFLAILIFGHYDFLIESILPAMRFIGHHNDISPLGQWLLATFKLEHGRKNDPICTASIQEGLQMFLAFCLYRSLTEEIRTLGELCIKLIIQINSIRHHYDCRTIQYILQQVGIENHRQGFSATLRMPKYAAFSICFRSDFGLFYCFAHCKVLMVTCQNLKAALPAAGEENKVLHNIQQPPLLEHSLIKCVELGIGGILVVAVFCFPLHEAI